MSINPSTKFIHFRWLPGIDFRKLMENRIKNIIKELAQKIIMVFAWFVWISVFDQVRVTLRLLWPPLFSKSHHSLQTKHNNCVKVEIREGMKEGWVWVRTHVQFVQPPTPRCVLTSGIVQRKSFVSTPSRLSRFKCLAPLFTPSSHQNLRVHPLFILSFLIEQINRVRMRMMMEGLGRVALKVEPELHQQPLSSDTQPPCRQLLDHLPKKSSRMLDPRDS
ncbi:hypothetical protein BCR33DRAFT_502337 [Rhizoclosmatium globosum]|uniref:Uncharacterized protein n=1 Tax=Rhizoclosmatium globosum TaxID=329046 RepID=A0A1Y2CVZ0_9FUNG|nr:hypothetical protein BCR33DRAFT_502337 [Rhizoclosmatium globosum]|eukprot:ORY51076.1 hypothetical protein BCR33DRAFT_502337 [Rhizoclosmatium globosum]